MLIDAATDLVAIEPLIRDFQVAAPDVAIEYVEYVSNDLFSKAAAQCSKNEPGADLFLSSSVDQLVKLANDGCGSRYRSITTDALPSTAKWRDEVFGFTYEAAALVYNRDMVANEDVPHTRTELLDLLRRKSALYAGRIGSYDIAQSGIGYLLASTDARNSSLYGRLIESFGRAGSGYALLYGRHYQRDRSRTCRDRIQSSRLLRAGRATAGSTNWSCSAARLYACSQPRRDDSPDRA